MKKNGSPELMVIGHRNPDTDSICAAIGYADLLQRVHSTEVEATCCGEISTRTLWVLEKAQVPSPRFVHDVRPRAQSVSRDEPIYARRGETIWDVYHRMVSGGVRSIPVVDGEGKPEGILHLLDLLDILMPSEGITLELRQVRAMLSNIQAVLEAESPHLFDEAQEEEFVLVVCASSVSYILERMEKYALEKIILLTGDREDVHELALEKKVRALIVTGGHRLGPREEDRARERGVSVLYSKHDTASTAQLIHWARVFDEALVEEFLAFGKDELLEDIRHRIEHVPQTIFPVVAEETGVMQGVFAKSDLLDPPRTRLVLVDHNEFSQAVQGAEEAEIVEVLDHHRISGNLVTQEPIRFINEPVGSTSTIVARAFRTRGLEPSPAIAMCLAAGIISDTLKLTSPTTTPIDREILDYLAQRAGIDIEQFAQDFFAAGSSLKSSSVEQAIAGDRKVYHEYGWSLSISQIEELGLNNFWDKKEALGKELERILEEESLDYACVMVTDITRHYSVLLVRGNSQLTEKITYPRLGGDLFELRGVVSRKKQLFPMLCRQLASIAKPTAP